MEGLVQQVLRLELNFLLLHFLAQVAGAGLVSGHQVYLQLPALLIITNDRQLHRTVEHICERLGCEIAPSDECVLRRIPEGIIGLREFRDLPRFEVVL